MNSCVRFFLEWQCSISDISKRDILNYYHSAQNYTFLSITNLHGSNNAFINSKIIKRIKYCCSEICFLLLL